MSLRVVEDAAQIRKAQKAFEVAFKRTGVQSVSVVIGFKGESFPTTVLWSRQLGIWLRPQVIKGSRYWNAFGIGEPRRGAAVPITCEVNFPLSGIDRSVGAVFVADERGGVFVAHRGRIGGGRKGIGAQLFRDKYAGDRVDVSDAGRTSTVALIGSLRSKRFPLHLKEFVEDVARIKAEAGSTAAIPAEGPAQRQFREEFEGSKEYDLQQRVEAACDHGLIVNRLRKRLADLGYPSPANDRHRDLFLTGATGRITAVFEVKPDRSPQSIYSGVGQLLIHNAGPPKSPNLILVLPETDKPALDDRLRKIGIQVLGYRWVNDEPQFPSLKDWKP